MTDLDRTLVSKRERTMLISFLISSAAPIVTGVTAIISRSATQIADFYGVLLNLHPYLYPGGFIANFTRKQNMMTYIVFAWNVLRI